MAKELKGTHSSIGQTVAPDFSKEEDLGDALYCHMQNISPLLRSARIASDPNVDGYHEDVHELLCLLVDCFERGLDEFDVCRGGRNNAAAKGPVVKIGKTRKVA